MNKDNDGNSGNIGANRESLPACNYAVTVDLNLFRLNDLQLDNLSREFFGFPMGESNAAERLFTQKVKICFGESEHMKLFLNALSCFSEDNRATAQ